MTRAPERPWCYWRSDTPGLIEMGAVRGRQVALPPHFHDEDQLTVVMKGRRRLVVGGRCHGLGPGQSLLIPAGVPHQSLNEDDGVVCVNLYVRAGFDVQAQWRQLLPDFDNWEPPTALRTPALPVPDLSASIQAMAHEVGLTREGYSRQFKRLHGVPPVTHRMLARLNAARSLLRLGMPLAQAAADAGFADQSHLGRSFLRHFGVSPGRYACGEEAITSVLEPSG